jgi:hypothetical protein
MTHALESDIATHAEARRGTDEMKAGIQDFVDWFVPRVATAYNRRYDEALGYDSWREYVRAEFPALPRMDGVEARREAVQALDTSTTGRGHGAAAISARDAADALGVTTRTVERDRQAIGPTNGGAVPVAPGVMTHEQAESLTEDLRTTALSAFLSMSRRVEWFEANGFPQLADKWAQQWNEQASEINGYMRGLGAVAR